MALPATITAGNAGSQGHARAVVRRVAAAYVFVFEGASPYTIRCYKSTNPGTVAFAGVGTGSEQNVGSGAQANIAAYDDGALFHVAVAVGTGLWYLVFDPASDTWTTKESVLAAGVDSVAVDVVVRSDGQPVIAYGGGGFVKSARRTGVNAWLTANVSSTTASLSGAVLGSSDRVHFFYVLGTTYRHRTLKSDNTLDAEQTIVAAGVTSGANLGIRPARHVKVGGAVGLFCGVCPSSGAAPTVLVADSADAPAWSSVAAATDAAPGAFANSPPMICAGTGSHEYVAYVRSGANDVQLAQRAVGGAFGVDATIGASTQSRLLGAVPYWDGAAWKLAYCYVNSSSPIYNETAIAGAAPPITYTDTPAGTVAVTAAANETFTDTPMGVAAVTAESADELETADAPSVTAAATAAARDSYEGPLAAVARPVELPVRDDEPGFTLLPADEDDISPEDDLAAAAASALDDGLDFPASDDAPEPFGVSWAFDFERGRFVRRGTSPARVVGEEALKQRLLTALHSARYAHAIFSDEFGIDRPQLPIGEAGDRARDAADDWRVAAREALMNDDRVADVELRVEYDPRDGVIYVRDLIVTTDEDARVRFDDLALALEG